VNAELSGGRNALHFAADYGQTDVIKCLIDAGADVNVCLIYLYQHFDKLLKYSVKMCYHLLPLKCVSSNRRHCFVFAICLCVVCKISFGLHLTNC